MEQKKSWFDELKINSKNRLFELLVDERIKWGVVRGLNSGLCCITWLTENINLPDSSKKKTVFL